MTAPLPRFSTSAEARGRLRLIAAVGMLALAALATGGIASLTQGSRAESTAPPLPAELTSSSGGAPLLDPAARLERQVREAERGVERARSAIRRARQLGQIDRALLDELEARLELVGDSPLDSLRHTYGYDDPRVPDDRRSSKRDDRSQLRPDQARSRDL